jgi:acetyl-CoA C-acetyltransferase
LVYIIDALRLPIGKANGIYKNILPEKLVAFLLKALVLRNNLVPQQISEIVLANAFGTGGNMARYASLLAGLPDFVSSFTLDAQCSGGLKAVEIGAAIVNYQNNSLVISGGLESKSLEPKKFYHKNDERSDTTSLQFQVAKFSPNQKSLSPLLDAASLTADFFDISKMEMMDWTVKSHKKAILAKENGALNSYMLSMDQSHFDQSIKQDLTLEKLYELGSLNKIDFTNSAHYNDGAALVLLANQKYMEAHSCPFLAKIIATSSVGFKPEMAPSAINEAIKAVLNQTNLSCENIDLFEINESFAVTPVAFAKEFDVEHNKINALGGNLAYGHPFGASGTINLIHLIASLHFYKKKRGLVAIPAAGGLATAMLIEIENVN